MMRFVTFLIAFLLITFPVFSQDAAPADDKTPASLEGRSPSETAPAEKDGKKEGGDAQKQAPPQQLSEAERITRLERMIEESEELLAELNSKLEKQKTDPESEYFQAQEEFDQLDEQLEELKEKKDEATTQAAGEMESTLEDLQKRWQLARDRFDLAIQERKALEEQKTAIETKLQQDKAALEKLLAPPATQPAAPTKVTPGQTAPAPAPAAAPEAGTPDAAAPAQAPVAAPGTPGAAAPAPGAPPAEEGEADKPTEEEIKATEELEQKKVETEQAEEEVRSITERMETLKKSIAAQEKQVETARKRVEVARNTEKLLKEQLDKLVAEGGNQAEIQELRTKIEEARQRFRSAQAEATELSDKLNDLRRDLNELQEEQLAAQAKAEESRQAEEQAQKKLEDIQNPFSIENMTIWLVEHGPRLVAILIGIVVALWLVRFADKRIVGILVGKSEHGSRVERENRASTLVGVFHNTATIVIIAGGILMVLDEIGIPIAPLLGGAAVFGLAIAFGAQNLVRDYFSGFMILMENQYGINDVVKIAGIAGLVERVTLRVTTLRDLEGTAHFIPNGQITTVSNMTHGWSRALFEIGVAYKEDVDKVMETLVDLGKEMRKDPKFGDVILDDPEMLGVDAFGDSAIVIKFFIKTKPLQQWSVKRQLLRRIKKKFDELGIEIPFPHRTVYHRTEDDFMPRVYFEESGPGGDRGPRGGGSSESS